MLEIAAWILFFGWPLAVIGVCWAFDALGLWEPWRRRWKEESKRRFGIKP